MFRQFCGVLIFSVEKKNRRITSFCALSIIKIHTYVHILNCVLSVYIVPVVLISIARREKSIDRFPSSKLCTNERVNVYADFFDISKKERAAILEHRQ